MGSAVFAGVIDDLVGSAVFAGVNDDLVGSAVFAGVMAELVGPAVLAGAIDELAGVMTGFKMSLSRAQASPITRLFLLACSSGESFWVCAGNVFSGFPTIISSSSLRVFSSCSILASAIRKSSSFLWRFSFSAWYCSPSVLALRLNRFSKASS